MQKLWDLLSMTKKLKVSWKHKQSFSSHPSRCFFHDLPVAGSVRAEEARRMWHFCSVLTKQHLWAFPPTSQFCFLSDHTRTPHSNQTSSALDWGTVDSCRGCLLLIYPTCTLGMSLCRPPLSPTPSSAPLPLQLQYVFQFALLFFCPSQQNKKP